MNLCTNKTVFITGGTGFLGTALIKSLLNQQITIICYGRNIEKIKQKFGNKVIATNSFDFENIDYIIHAACPTKSKTLSQEPVEVINTIYSLTKESLELAKRNNARYVFLSSMEVYDNLDGKVNETQQGTFNLSNSRSSYPVAKQLAELLVNSYRNEYNVNTCILRLSQIFGPGTSVNDNRLFNYMIKQCIANEDIILKTLGDKFQNTCFIDDAIYFIINVLFSDVQETINITNENYCSSINELAKKIIKIIGSKNKLVHKLDTTNYPPSSKHKISGEKIQKMFPTYKMETFENAIIKTKNYLTNL